MNQLGSDGDRVRDVKEYIKALSVQAAIWEENATEAPSHSDTFREAEMASGKSILTQQVVNTAGCEGQTEEALTQTDREAK